MANTTATIYHAPSRDARDPATSKAIALLKDFGYESKLVNVRHLNSSSRRDLEISGLSYPIIKVNGKHVVRRFSLYSLG